jgi:hypothetical protein
MLRIRRDPVPGALVRSHLCLERRGLNCSEQYFSPAEVHRCQRVKPHQENQCLPHLPAG